MVVANDNGNNEAGTLEFGEHHPCATMALSYVYDWIKRTGIRNVTILQESMASCALSGNRTAEVCGETLRRCLESEPVSDRYVFGLAWFLQMEEDAWNRNIKRKKK